MPKKMKRCVVCGKPFKAEGRGSGRKMTCSPECSRQHARDLQLQHYYAHRPVLDRALSHTCDEKRCSDCRYYRPLNSVEKIRVCHYSFDTGLSRGCPPGMQCTRRLVRA